MHRSQRNHNTRQHRTPAPFAAAVAVAAMLVACDADNDVTEKIDEASLSLGQLAGHGGGRLGPEQRERLSNQAINALRAANSGPSADAASLLKARAEADLADLKDSQSRDTLAQLREILIQAEHERFEAHRFAREADAYRAFTGDERAEWIAQQRTKLLATLADSQSEAEAFNTQLGKLDEQIAKERESIESLRAQQIEVRRQAENAELDNRMALIRESNRLRGIADDHDTTRAKLVVERDGVSAQLEAAKREVDNTNAAIARLAQADADLEAERAEARAAAQDAESNAQQAVARLVDRINAFTDLYESTFEAQLESAVADRTAAAAASQRASSGGLSNVGVAAAGSDRLAAANLILAAIRTIDSLITQAELAGSVSALDTASEFANLAQGLRTKRDALAQQAAGILQDAAQNVGRLSEFSRERSQAMQARLEELARSLTGEQAPNPEPAP